jgi:DNA-directed RNA polymerase subunit RPC12/RpoP
MSTPTEPLGPLQVLTCSTCGKKVSTGFYPIKTETPDEGIIIRAYIECPECLESESMLEAKTQAESSGEIEK